MKKLIKLLVPMFIIAMMLCSTVAFADEKTNNVVEQKTEQQLTAKFPIAQSAQPNTGNATGSTQAATVFHAIFAVVRVVCLAVGALFAIMGIVKYTIAHAQEDSPSQQKAAMQLAAGIALVVLGFGIQALKLEQIVTQNASMQPLSGN